MGEIGKDCEKALWDWRKKTGVHYKRDSNPEWENRSAFAAGWRARDAEVAALTERAEAAERRVVAAREAVAELRATLALPDMTAPFTLAYVHGYITSAETVARLVAAWDAVDAALAAPAPGATGEGGVSSRGAE